MEFPLIVIGGGGHAKVLISVLRLLHRTVIGFVDVNPSLPPLLEIAHLGDDRAVYCKAPNSVRLVNAVSSPNSTVLHRSIYERFCDRDFVFQTVIHPAAVVAPEVRIDDGAQIMAGAMLQPGSRVGMNSIINSGACIDHDCLIDAHAHVAPGVTLSGNVHVGEGAHIGTGASVIQGVSIGAASFVGAGAVVINDVPPGVTVVGVPARVVQRRNAGQ